MTLARAEIDDFSPGPDGISIRPPRAEDAAAINDLIAACPPLDRNSLYANLLQCTHFAGACALARDADGVLAWVSGYLPPQQSDTYFLWQVAAHPRARRRGLPMRLISDILGRDNCRDVRQLKTTITPDNQASWKLFTRFAERLGAPLRRQPWFDRERHFAGRHDSEFLVTIGPIPRPLPAF